MNAEEHKQIIETDARMTDVLYEFCLTAIDRSTDHFARIDSKATTLASVVGVIITLLFTIAASAFPDGLFASGFGCASQILFIVTIMLLFTSLGFCIRALWLRNLRDVPLIREVVESVRHSERKPGDEVALKKHLIGPFSRVDHSFCMEASFKTADIRAATSWLSAAFITLALSAVCFTIHISVQTYDRAKRPNTGAGADARTDKR